MRSGSWPWADRNLQFPRDAGRKSQACHQVVVGPCQPGDAQEDPEEQAGNGPGRHPWVSSMWEDLQVFLNTGDSGFGRVLTIQESCLRWDGASYSLSIRSAPPSAITMQGLGTTEGRDMFLALCELSHGPRRPSTGSCPAPAHLLAGAHAPSSHWGRSIDLQDHGQESPRRLSNLVCFPEHSPHLAGMLEFPQ